MCFLCPHERRLQQGKQIQLFFLPGRTSYLTVFLPGPPVQVSPFLPMPRNRPCFAKMVGTKLPGMFPSPCRSFSAFWLASGSNNLTVFLPWRLVSAPFLPKLRNRSFLANLVGTKLLGMFPSPCRIFVESLLAGGAN
jgi:hypothetical protein